MTVEKCVWSARSLHVFSDILHLFLLPKASGFVFIQEKEPRDASPSFNSRCRWRESLKGHVSVENRDSGQDNDRLGMRYTIALHHDPPRETIVSGNPFLGLSGNSFYLHYAGEKREAIGAAINYASAIH